MAGNLGACILVKVDRYIKGTAVHLFNVFIMIGRSSNLSTLLLFKSAVNHAARAGWPRIVLALTMKRSIFLYALVGTAVLAIGGAPSEDPPSSAAPSFLAAATPWADSMFSTLSLDEKI